MFFAPDTGAKRNLADLIMQKIEEKKQDEEQQASRQFDPKIIEVYSKVGKILQQYLFSFPSIVVTVLVSFLKPSS